MIFRLGELFSGPGGLALGAKLMQFEHENVVYKIEHMWANDNHHDSCETYRKNIIPEFPDRVICKDVKELDIMTLPPIDSFAYGFPCNDFSIVGEQKGINGKYGPLYRYGVEVLEIHNPKWFLAENVGGISNANEGATFKNILSELENAGEFGYRLVVNKYKFEEYKVPQNRHRIIIVGIRKDLDVEFRVPAPTSINKEDQITVYQALLENPISPQAKNHEFTNHPKLVIERLNAIPPGENAWWEDLPDHLKLDVKSAKLSQIYRRLKPDEPAYTITGSGGGGTHGYRWDEPRALTNRERARLQTFPDDFIFYGGKESVRRQIGMAVPPLGAKIIIDAILKTFAGINYPSVDANL
jgi:DNA (cytosine-5)-methyltransferase 1